MSETYIITAKTVEEAMAIANREYGGAGRDISFDILEMPKKGFLGIGAKEAKIKVTVTEEEEINLGSIVAEMKAMRVHTDRDGEEKPAKQPKQEKPAQEKKPVEKQEKPAEKPQKQNQPKQDGQKPQQSQQPKNDQPKQKPAQPKTEAKAEAPKAEAVKAEKKPDAEKPAVKQPKQEKPVQEKKPVEKQAHKAEAAPKTEAKAEPRAEAAKAAPKSREPMVTSEARADGRLENLPEYKFDNDRKKTPVHKETGAGVKSYNASPLHTEAVADGSVGYSGPVQDVRWDSARDLKAAEAAAEAAKKAAEEAARRHAMTLEVEKNEAKWESSLAKPVERVEYERNGEVDVAAIDAAIEAMVEEMPAPDARKKTGVTRNEMDHAIAFVTGLLANMQVDARAVECPCPEGEEYEIEGDANIYPAIEIVGDGTGILIGHHGETLDAIQYLLNLAAIRHSDNQGGDYVKISLDIENYRAKREETLRSLARRMAARAIKYKRNVFLEPMNAYERRIIHSELQAVENVSTHSVGTDKNRKIVVTYEGPDKQPDRRSLSGQNSGEEKRRDRRRRGEKRDNGENKAEKQSAAAESAAAEVQAAEGAEGQTQDKPHKSRNRSRNRNRRRGGGNGENRSAASVTAGEQADLPSLDDPSVYHPEARTLESDLSAFPQPADEPVEHLREN